MSDMKDTITPLPWRWQGEDYRGGWGWMLLVGAGGEGVGFSSDGDKPHKGLRAHTPVDPLLCLTGMMRGPDSPFGFHMRQPDADFMLKAVNCHDELVAALRYARRFLKAEDHDISFVDAALAKAGEA